MGRSRTFAAVLAAALSASVLVSQPAAAATLTNLTASAFTQATVADSWTRPPTQSGTNAACLTSGVDVSTTPIPGCNLGIPDANGAGALRLTPSNQSEIGVAFSSLSLPTKQGVDIRFNSYQYSGSGGNGISLMLAATDPALPSAPSTTGPLGGSLGYSANVSGGTFGLPYGYLGFGLDAYGDYTNSGYAGFGCGPPPNINSNTVYPDTVTIRGPGNGYDGYCIEHTSAENGGALSGSLHDQAATSRSGAVVPVEIAINPDASPVVTASGLNVPAQSYAIEVTPIGGTPNVITGVLPTTGNNNVMASQFPPDWVDQTTGLPHQLTLGWAASTGGAYEIHEINSLQSSTLNGQLPVLQLNGSNNGPGGQLPEGANVQYTLTPSLSPADGSESEDVTLTAVFPADVTPGTASGAGWSCVTNAQTVTCTRAIGVAIPAGTALSQVTVPAAVGPGATGSKTVSLLLASNDSPPAIGEVTASVVHLPGAPTGLDAEAVGGVATVTWSPPASDGGTPITSYRVTATSTGPTPTLVKTVNAPMTSTSLCCLASDALYGFSVEAINSVGSSPVATLGNVSTLPQGYRTTAGDGGVFDFGAAEHFGSAASIDLAAPVVGMAETPGGGGYWLVAADGGVFAYGNAVFLGNAVGVTDAPITGIAATPDGGGYWLVGSDGGVFSYGNAMFHGSAVGSSAARAIGIASAGVGGYWLAFSDGTVVAFGSAHQFPPASYAVEGEMTAIAAKPDGLGYWLVTDDAAVTAFGTARILPDSAGISDASVRGIKASPDGEGYWLTAEDGGVFAFGSAGFFGSMAGQPLNASMSGIS